MTRVGVAAGRRKSSRLGRKDKNALEHKGFPDDISAHDSIGSASDEKYVLDGVKYATYQEMVDAKKKKNIDFMAREGLLKIPLRPTARRVPKRSSPTEGQRRSKRLKGEKAEDGFVEDEKRGAFTFSGITATTSADSSTKPNLYQDRINDGSDMTLDQVLRATGDKWFDEGKTIPLARAFSEQMVGSVTKQTPDEHTTELTNKSIVTSSKPSNKIDDKFSSQSVMKQIERLSLGGFPLGDSNAEKATIKVVPDRIYGITMHPSLDHLIICAGDKQGHIGIWNATSRQDIDSSVHLFRYHTMPVSSMEWIEGGTRLLSTSYDNTCRLWNLQTETFEQVFAAYSDDPLFSSRVGFGLDTGRNFWFQSSTVDHRNPLAFFLSTSLGTVLHVDLRTPKRITWNKELSDKKINTTSLHPNGYSFLSNGLDCCVKLWDLRKLDDKKKSNKAVAVRENDKSINSAYFSPITGTNIVVTKAVTGIEVIQDFHLSDSPIVTKLNHDNQTGRWLSTFMARWHPCMDDLFCIGSMQKPRNVHVYDTEKQVAAISGLSSVVSRCCFHSSTDELVLVGGSSSGRVSLFRECHSH